MQSRFFVYHSWKQQHIFDSSVSLKLRQIRVIIFLSLLSLLEPIRAHPGNHKLFCAAFYISQDRQFSCSSYHISGFETELGFQITQTTVNCAAHDVKNSELRTRATQVSVRDVTSTRKFAPWGHRNARNERIGCCPTRVKWFAYGRRKDEEATHLLLGRTGTSERERHWLVGGGRGWIVTDE